MIKVLKEIIKALKKINPSPSKPKQLRGRPFKAKVPEEINPLKGKGKAPSKAKVLKKISPSEENTPEVKQPKERPFRRKGKAPSEALSKAKVPKEINPSLSEESNTSFPKELNTSLFKELNTSLPKKLNTSFPKESNTSLPNTSPPEELNHTEDKKDNKKKKDSKVLCIAQQDN